MPLMQCGCVAQGRDQKTGKPVCVVHIGLTPDAEIVATTKPDLTGRFSKCIYCGETKPSSTDLPFFVSTPKHEFDSHYNGCRGWD